MSMFDKLSGWLWARSKEEFVLSWTPYQWTCVLYVYYLETGNYFPVSLVPQFMEDLKERRSMRLLRGGAPLGERSGQSTSFLGDLGPEHEATELDFVFCKREGMEVETTTGSDGAIYCSACHAHLGQDGLTILVREANGATSRVVIR